MTTKLEANVTQDQWMLSAMTDDEVFLAREYFRQRMAHAEKDMVRRALAKNTNFLEGELFSLRIQPVLWSSRSEVVITAKEN